MTDLYLSVDHGDFVYEFPVALPHDDALDLRDRCLELFKVASKNGVPEIWLMGQRLLPAPA